jgi:hypothetical protein
MHAYLCWCGSAAWIRQAVEILYALNSANLLRLVIYIFVTQLLVV